MYFVHSRPCCFLAGLSPVGRLADVVCLSSEIKISPILPSAQLHKFCPFPLEPQLWGAPVPRVSRSAAEDRRFPLKPPDGCPVVKPSVLSRGMIPTFELFPSRAVCSVQVRRPVEAPTCVTHPGMSCSSCRGRVRHCTWFAAQEKVSSGTESVLELLNLMVSFCYSTL